MSLLLKIVDAETSPAASDNPHSVYADVMSCTFQRHSDGSATALLSVRDAVKTANVAGYCDHEVRVGFTGTAYLMNDNGRTISSFTASSSGSWVTGGSIEDGRIEDIVRRAKGSLSA